MSLFHFASTLTAQNEINYYMISKRVVTLLALSPNAEKNIFSCHFSKQSADSYIKQKLHSKKSTEAKINPRLYHERRNVKTICHLF